MCLGIPAKVLKLWNDSGLTYAKVDLGGIVKEVIVALDDVKEGDYVIIHAGIAISKIKEEEIRELNELLKELLQF